MRMFYTWTMLFNDANFYVQQFYLKGNVQRVRYVSMYFQEDPKLEKGQKENCLSEQWRQFIAYW